MTTYERATCLVDVPGGPVALPLLHTRVPASRATVILAPGAGAGADHPLLAAMAEALGSIGMSTVRFDFPYRARGRRMPGPAAHAVLAWEAVFEQLRSETQGGVLIAAGRSYGGRMASMAAARGEITPDALVYFGYPLHAPGRPDQERAAHLGDIDAPQLFVSGRRDPFVMPTERLDAIVSANADATIVWIDDAGHSFEQPKDRRTPSEVASAVVAAAHGFLDSITESTRDTPGGHA